MANNETTTKFKVDISELKKAMQDAKRQVAVANSEFKAVASTMDDWSKSSEGISAKLKQLDSNLKSQKTILKSLEDQYELTVKEMGEGSKAADDLKIKINNQKAVVNQTEREISKYEASLEEVSEAEKIAARTGKDVAEVLEDTANKAEDAGDGFTVFKGAIATFAGNALTSLVGGLKDAASNLLGLAEETREYRTELGKLETAFTTAGHTTDAATQTYKDLYAVLGDEGQSVEAANMLAKLCDNEKELSEWTTIATGVYGTFGSSLPIEGLTEAANETAKTGALTGSLADALNWAGVSEDDFQKKLDKCSTEQERQKLITETLNGLYSDAAKKYEETNKSVMDANRANSDYTDTLAIMGEKIEPVTTTLKDGFNDLLQKLLELVGDVDISAFTSKIEEGFKILTDDVLPAIKDGFQWILDNKDPIIAGLAGIAGGFVAFKVASLIMGVVDAFKAFKLANEGATVAQWLLNAAMNANPIVLVATLLVALVAGIVAFVATNDEARAKLKEVWETIKGFVGKAVESMTKFFTETVPQALNKMVDWFKQLPEKVSTWLTNTITKVSNWAGNMKQKATDTATNFLNTVVNYVKQLPSKVWEWLTNVVSKVTSWGTNMYNKAKEVATSFVNKVVEFVKQLPSKVWEWLTNVVSKVASWGTNMYNKAKEVATKFVSSVIDKIKETPEKIWSTLKNAFSKIADWGSNLASKGKEAAKKLLDAVVDKVKEIPDKLKSIGSDIVKGLWNGINDMTSWIKSKIKGFGDSVLKGLKDFFGIHSPSKVFADEVGKWIPEGIAVGIDKNAKTVLSSMKDLTTSSVGAARTGLSSIGGVGKSGVVNNFTQVINSPKQPSRLDIYRQTKNLLGFAGGGM